MFAGFRFVEAPRRLRAFVRAHEASLVLLAALIGLIGGLAVGIMGMAVAGLVLGYIHLVIALIAVFVVMLFFGAMFLHLGPHWHVFS